MTKKKIKNKEIVVPILNHEYKVIVVWGDFKFLKRIAESWGYSDTEKWENDGFKSNRGETYDTQDCHPIIYLPRCPKTYEEIGTLAHEAVHAIDYNFDKIKEGHTDEIFAHSVGAIVRGVLKHRR